MAERHVVIVGAGFGGLAAARRLARRDARGHVRVTLVDRRNHHTFQPLLYQVATAGLVPQDVGHSVRAIVAGWPNVAFRLGEVRGADFTRRVLRLDDGELAFDELIVAAGAVTADFGVPGVAEHAFPLKDLGEAVALRDHILRRFEGAGAAGAAEGELTFVVAGGGPTGVEVAGALRELVDHALRRDFPEVDMAAVRIVLVEQAGELLGAFPPASRDYTARTLRARGVEVRLGTAIAEARPDAVVLAGGERLPARTLVWAAGVRANPLAEALGLPTGRGGRVAVDEHLRVPGLAHVYAVGDIAAMPDGHGGPAPQLAPAAIQAARHVARVILRGDVPPFRYRDKGVMSTIGRNAAVARLPGGIRLRGRLGWLSWLGLHLVMLIGFRNRLSVLLNWAWSYLTYDHAARVVFQPAEPRAAAQPSGSAGA
ncbi:MAG TPA: NAD(P)/FAD-dependent oxidoreductase [Egibacteraceae bacterium]|nr:NAD(P)/FAD-dependent oxidoreductase [Egibacteraceae bacterium]